MQYVVAVIGQGNGLTVAGLNQIAERVLGARYGIQFFGIGQPLSTITIRQGRQFAVWGLCQQIAVGFHLHNQLLLIHRLTRCRQNAQGNQVDRVDGGCAVDTGDHFFCQLINYLRCPFRAVITSAVIFRTPVRALLIKEFGEVNRLAESNVYFSEGTFKRTQCTHNTQQAFFFLLLAA